MFNILPTFRDIDIKGNQLWGYLPVYKGYLPVFQGYGIFGTPLYKPQIRKGKVGYIQTDSLIRTATLFVSYFKYWNKK